MKSKAPVSVLDVGALTNHYLPYQSWIKSTAIDLEPRHPTVRRCDFFDFPVVESQFDVIVLSLVLNFVPRHSMRGEMLVRCRTMLKANGFLFLILPLACVSNSRFLTRESFQHLMTGLHFELVSVKESRKLVYYMFKLPLKPDHLSSCVVKRKVISDGAGKNNFSISLSPDTAIAASTADSDAS
eukprot:TRINITY_DN3564_c0_g1_i2.p1 TRINITY_DN3564_c0_g1~~TRINITY_DN3564_c0_g1_i2.p1  ORF type:complete len:184 (-),score=26.74 TRINITY_DN3564_c0_g1_i2:292-843(-)